MERSAPQQHDSRLRLVWICFSVVTAILLGIIGWGVYMAVTYDTRAEVVRFTQTHPLDFTVFYPAVLPDGFRLDETSIMPLEGAGMQYTLVDGAGKRVLVTQQRRPKIMEEVAKTQEFTTSVGQAYLAELNSRTAGFLVSQETLVIVTSPDQIDTAILRKVIESLAPIR